MTIVIDATLGPAAELLNAFGVQQRIVEWAPILVASLVAQESDAVGDFVFFTHTSIGGRPAAAARLRTKR